MQKNKCFFFHLKKKKINFLKSFSVCLEVKTMIEMIFLHNLFIVFFLNKLTKKLFTFREEKNSKTSLLMK